MNIYSVFAKAELLEKELRLLKPKGYIIVCYKNQRLIKTFDVLTISRIVKRYSLGGFLERIYLSLSKDTYTNHLVRKWLNKTLNEHKNNGLAFYLVKCTPMKIVNRLDLRDKQDGKVFSRYCWYLENKILSKTNKYYTDRQEQENIEPCQLMN